MRITHENTDTKNPGWVYFKGDFDLCFEGAVFAFPDCATVDISIGISDACPEQWKECKAIHVERRDSTLVFPMTVYCRIEGTKAEHISDSEVCTILQQALNKMVKRLATSDWPFHTEHLLKQASKVTLKCVTRLDEIEKEHASYLIEVLGYDLDEDQDEPAEASVQTNAPVLSKQQ